MMSRHIPCAPVLAVLAAGLIMSLVYAVTFGTVRISAAEVYGVIWAELTGVGGAGRVRDVVLLLRLPRLVLAAGIGAALSLCGLIMQALVRNPLAEPYILGVSSGAYAGAASAILLGLGRGLGGSATGIMAFAGALCACAAVMALARSGGRPDAVKLILAGTAISALCSAFSNFIIYVSGDRDRLQTLVNWTMGSLQGATWRGNAAILAAAAGGTLFFLANSRALNLLVLGDDAATALGVNARMRRLWYLPVCALLTGLCVNAAGTIAFAGLVVPHIMRLLFGPDHKKLVPLCAFGGAILLVWADVFCRTLLAGVELPVGIATAAIGAPCFIWLVARRKYHFGGEP